MTHTTKERAQFLGLLNGTTEFMRLAGQNTEGGDFVDYDIRDLRRGLLEEEYAIEYLDAEFDDDLVATVDALLDIIVVSWGTLLAYIGEERALAAAAEVVRSNLDKVTGEIKRAPNGKILKPEGWVGPDIEGVVNG
ncbi:hypothetical protein JRC04_05170 [Mycolicibacterium sp. S2-37]|uniref:hypothetical protein n=1 Tax=Mycolicibacterium sp. S2-37 TaxID=2810297 RepID=UPI001A94B9A1|nr:hypothetical protein [Mycolicibacterium sp. S2-37]MBO0676848.1 hypothetical protein [Mycolicibacterium sp. S2-37]